MVEPPASRPSALEIADAAWTRPATGRGINGHAQHNGAAIGIAEASVGRWVGTTAPLIRFVVADMIPACEVTIFGGAGGSGKSALAQAAATCVVADLPFLGHAVERGAAVYLTAEDRDPVLHVRQERICRELGLDMAPLDGKLFVKAAPDRDLFLFSDGRPTELADSLERELATIRDLRLVVIDSAALVFDDEEIARRPVGRFMRDLSRRAQRLGAAVVLITHTSKSSDDTPAKAFSGSTGWVWQARSAILLKAQTKDDGPSLTVVKANLGPSGKKIDLVWTDNHVLVAADAPNATVDRLSRRSLEREILDRVAAAWNKDAPLSATPSVKDRYLPGVMSRAGGHKAVLVQAAMVAMLDAGILVRGQRLSRTTKGLRIEKAPDWYEGTK